VKLANWQVGVVFSLVSIAVVGCGDSNVAQEAPAHVEHAVPESALATLTLTPDAVRRLGIETAAVERRSVAVTRLLGGQLLVPPGRVMTVAAPTAGIVLGPERGDMLSAGAKLEAGDPVMQLLPLPPDSELLAANEDIPIRVAEVTVARARAERAEKLLTGRSGSQEQLEQAQSELVRAEAALRLARSQQSLLRGAEAAGLTPITLLSRDGGTLAQLNVAAGQLVAAATPLFTVETHDRLWVRVPVYSSDENELNTAVPALVELLGATPGSGRMAQPIAGPPTATPAAGSIDVFYELDNQDDGYRAGQRVQLTVPLHASGERLVVPWSAVLQDIHGGAWVYVATAPGVYVRTRVELARVQGDLAILARGPQPGTRVVTVAVAELAGTEFGVAH
jgi:RND family efflux transporter MFP subunit